MLEKGIKMRVCVVGNDGVVSTHFGHSNEVSLYEVYGNHFDKLETVQIIGHEHEGVPRVVCSFEPDVIICGSLGEKAKKRFEEHGISMMTGANGPVDHVMSLFIQGVLKSVESTCQGHTHDDDHDCHHDH
jgi:predicted Fe-Mo cluster-binding NifX family protein